MSLYELGKHIKEYRLKNNFTQQEFAKILGISKQTLSTYENGTAVPEMTVALKFVEISGANADELIFLEDYIDKIESPNERTAVIEAFNKFEFNNSAIFQDNQKRTEFFDTLIANLRNNIKGRF